jgi:hypothetical protein
MDGRATPLTSSPKGFCGSPSPSESEQRFGFCFQPLYKSCVRPSQSYIHHLSKSCQSVHSVVLLTTV